MTTEARPRGAGACPPPRCLLEIQGLKVDRGGVPVLEIPSFQVREGEFVSLIGPNGSGKSTLLLSIMCLLRRVEGRILYRGGEITTDRDALAFRRRIAMVLQDPLLFDASVHENVAAGLHFRGVPRSETRRRVSACLERFHLTHMAERSARKLSGGEARRVSLARAVAVEPDVLLLDEPFANLDLPTRQSITEDLERTIRGTGMAAILVTHDRSEALRLSDRIVVMHDGRIVQADAPSVVMNNPANEFIAVCMGMETVVEGVVERSERGQLTVAVANRRIEAIGDSPSGARVYCCIRPENVTIELARPSEATSARNLFPARVVGTSSMDLYLKIQLDCGFSLASYVTPESFTSLKLEPGRQVFASFKATAVHVIPRTEGVLGQPA